MATRALCSYLIQRSGMLVGAADKKRAAVAPTILMPRGLWFFEMLDNPIEPPLRLRALAGF